MARGMGAMGPALLPPTFGGLSSGAPQKGFPAPVGKSLRIQNLGNLMGMRGAGMSKMGGSQLAHSFNHYGKQPQLEGGTEPQGGSSNSNAGWGSF